MPLAKKDQHKTTLTCPYGTFVYRRMPFGLCNAPTTFQRFMMTIFSNLIENSIKIFMDGFSIFYQSFDARLKNLNVILKRCKETRLVLNWEKCQFMVDECIVLGHKVSSTSIEVDPANVEVIAQLPLLNCVNVVRSFLGHVGFYKRFVRDFSKIAKPMNNLIA